MQGTDCSASLPVYFVDPSDRAVDPSLAPYNEGLGLAVPVPAGVRELVFQPNRAQNLKKDAQYYAQLDYRVL